MTGQEDSLTPQGRRAASLEMARDALLDLYADSTEFTEIMDGDEVNGRAVVTCSYVIRTDELQLRTLCEAVGITIRYDQSPGDALQQAIDALPSPPTQSERPSQAPTTSPTTLSLAELRAQKQAEAREMFKNVDKYEFRRVIEKARSAREATPEEIKAWAENLARDCVAVGEAEYGTTLEATPSAYIAVPPGLSSTSLTGITNAQSAEATEGALEAAKRFMEEHSATFGVLGRMTHKRAVEIGGELIATLLTTREAAVWEKACGVLRDSLQHYTDECDVPRRIALEIALKELETLRSHSQGKG